MPAASAAAYLRRRRRLEATINLRFSQRSRSINWKLISHRRRPARRASSVRRYAGVLSCRCLRSPEDDDGDCVRRPRNSRRGRPSARAARRAGLLQSCMRSRYVSSRLQRRKEMARHPFQSSDRQPANDSDRSGWSS